MRQMIPEDIGMQRVGCTACGTTDDVVIKSVLPDVPICRDCFMTWYDPDEACSSWADVGRQSLARKRKQQEKTDVT